MTVKRDPRTGNWFFRTWVQTPRGPVRVFGTPGKAGYRDLAQTKVGAAEAERRAIAAAMSGKPLVAQATEVPTVREYSVVFLATYAAQHKPSERQSKVHILDGTVLPYFGDMRLDAVRQEDIDRYSAELRKAGRKVKTINNRLAVLSSLLKYAVRNGVIPAPAYPLSFSKPDVKPETSAVNRTDLEQLLTTGCLDQRYRVIVLLAAEVGLRAGEILGLQWADIADGQLTVRRAASGKNRRDITAPKHNKARTVPLSPRVVAAFATLPRSPTWVALRRDGQPFKYNGLIKAIKRCYVRAGVTLPRFPLHGLRHMFGTELAGRGVPLPIIQELMGHADIKTTLRYVHVNEAQKRTAIADVFRGQPVGSEAKNAP